MLLAFQFPPPPDQGPSQPSQRRLTDKVRAAVNAACDEGAAGIASCLMVQLESLITYPSRLPAGHERRRLEGLTDLGKRLQAWGF
jgi:hypothetical protein